MTAAVKINGLAQFTRDLKKLDSELPKVVRIALNEAADIVVDEAKSRVPRRSGRAQASIKARSTRTSVRVSAGGNRAPYYPWLDFGGRVGRKRSVKRAFLAEGRYLYAAYFDKRSKFEEVLADALLGVARSAGVEVD